MYVISLLNIRGMGMWGQERRGWMDKENVLRKLLWTISYTVIKCTIYIFIQKLFSFYFSFCNS